MNRKIKNTLALVGLLIIILVLGGAVLFISSAVNKADQLKLQQLKSTHYDTGQLNKQYQGLAAKAAVLDSVLAQRKFNIPQNLSSISFYNFLNKVSSTFSQTLKQTLSS